MTPMREAWSGPWLGRTLLERFEQKYIPEPNSGCWFWVGSLTHDGYPRIKVAGKSIGGHRVSFELFKGPIAEGLEVDHRCNMPCCVNPDHLDAVTPLENFERCGNPLNLNRLKQACGRGHPFAGENLYVDASGKRGCQTCRREAKQRHRRKHAAAA